MEQIVQTAAGKISGLTSENGDCRMFFGVPYAQPPVGALRFCRPQPKQPWQGVRPAKAFGPKPHQADLSLDPFYGREFYAGTHFPMSEDCLYLNLWAPAQGQGLPVLVWIHGGAFTHGCGHEAEFDGLGFARKGVILVTLNYRVGALGFYTHADNAPGNLGLWDQLAALQWVRDNIAAFGGDPQQVTVAGQSAGCMSVQCLVSSPLSRGLMRGAILQSGGGLPGLRSDWESADQQAVSRRLEQLLEADGPHGLRNLSPEAVTQAGYQVMEERGGLCWQPFPDGELLLAAPGEQARQGRVHDIAYMIGSTADDMGPKTAALLHESALGWAENQQKLGRRAPYLYHFARRLPGDSAGAFHSCELWYEFETLDRCWRPLTPADWDLARTLSGHFANFVKYQDPNGPDLPQWLPHTQDLPGWMRYDESSGMSQKL